MAKRHLLDGTLAKSSTPLDGNVCASVSGREGGLIQKSNADISGEPSSEPEPQPGQDGLLPVYGHLGSISGLSVEASSTDLLLSPLGVTHDTPLLSKNFGTIATSIGTTQCLSANTCIVTDAVPNPMASATTCT
jgi:hypothetical protein